jgi:hypothetical protein
MLQELLEQIETGKSEKNVDAGVECKINTDAF